jgi:hypothetical protein
LTSKLLGEVADLLVDKLLLEKRLLFVVESLFENLNLCLKGLLIGVFTLELSLLGMLLWVFKLTR